MRYFLVAVQFLTRLPTPALRDFRPEWIARAVPYYPVVGWLAGAIAALVWLAAARFVPGLPAAFVAIGAGLLTTGGFHEDGLADTADGLGGGQDRERRLAIMKDSRLGSYGALALIVVLGAKAALLAMLSPLQGAVALIVVGGGARALVAPVMALLPYARPTAEAKLKPAPEGVRGWEAALALAIGLVPFALVGAPARALAALLLGALAVAAVARAARRLIGGWTGDVLGACEALAEVALLAALAARA